jgi:hypothetical protein
MKIQTIKAEPSAKVSRLIAEANVAKKRVLDYLDAHPADGWGSDYVRACLRFADTSYAMFAEQLPVNQIDRTKSLIGGPLFVSARHPHPTGANGLGMYPVMQLDMGWVSLLCSKKFEQCLLQFWWDTDEKKAHLRKVPTTEICKAELLPLVVNSDVAAEGELWMPEEWILNAGALAHQVTKCSPIGVTFPGVDSGRDSLMETYGDAAEESFLHDLETFSSFPSRYEVESTSKMTQVAKLFGYFHSSQLGPDEFNEEGCLMKMDWASGNGILFYTHDAATGLTSFTFYFDK